MGASLAAPASSQDADVFTIDPNQGVPGDLVQASVDPDAVADACYTEPDQVQGADGPLATAGAAFTAAGGEYPLGSNEATAAGVLGIILTVLGTDANRAADVERMLENFFVLTFVDIGSMEPVGDRSNFDAATGEGQIVVPDLAPGLWAIAATCVFPATDDPEAIEAAILAARDVLLAYPELQVDGVLDPTTILLTLLGLANPGLGDVVGEAVLTAALPLVAAPQARWVQPFTIPADLPAADPAVEAFCAAIPQLPALGEQLIETLAGLPEDDGSMSQDEWAAAEDWAALATELEGLVGQIEDLLAAGDTSRPDDLADEWASATAPLRQLRDALQAVDYDLSTESGRMIAGQLREQAVGAGEGAGEDPAVAALTEWFLANCMPSDTPAAPPAQPAGAQPTYTG